MFVLLFKNNTKSNHKNASIYDILKGSLIREQSEIKIIYKNIYTGKEKQQQDVELKHLDYLYNLSLIITLYSFWTT